MHYFFLQRIHLHQHYCVRGCVDSMSMFARKLKPKPRRGPRRSITVLSAGLLGTSQVLTPPRSTFYDNCFVHPLLRFELINSDTMHGDCTCRYFLTDTSFLLPVEFTIEFWMYVHCSPRLSANFKTAPTAFSWCELYFVTTPFCCRFPLSNQGYVLSWAVSGNDNCMLLQNE